MKQLLLQLFTESDNTTFDIARVLAAASVIAGIGLQIYAVVGKSQPFDMQVFGVGTGALFAGVGVALGMKKDSKP